MVRQHVPAGGTEAPRPDSPGPGPAPAIISETTGAIPLRRRASVSSSAKFIFIFIIFSCLKDSRDVYLMWCWDTGPGTGGAPTGSSSSHYCSLRDATCDPVALGSEPCDALSPQQALPTFRHLQHGHEAPECGVARLKSLKTHAGNFHNGIATPLKQRLAVPIHKRPAGHGITRPAGHPGSLCRHRTTALSS